MAAVSTTNLAAELWGVISEANLNFDKGAERRIEGVVDRILDTEMTAGQKGAAITAQFTYVQELISEEYRYGEWYDAFWGVIHTVNRVFARNLEEIFQAEGVQTTKVLGTLITQMRTESGESAETWKYGQEFHSRVDSHESFLPKLEDFKARMGHA